LGAAEQTLQELPHKVTEALQAEAKTFPKDVAAGFQGNMSLFPVATDITVVEARQRSHFWFLAFLGTYGIVVVAGTAIMQRWGLCQKCVPVRSHLFVDPSVAENRNTVQGLLSPATVQWLVSFAFGVQVTADLVACIWSLCTGRLSTEQGLDFEVYFILFSLNGVWMVLQAWAKPWFLPPSLTDPDPFGDWEQKTEKSFATSAFLEATVFGMMPIISDAYDTLKDVLFGALCLQSNYLLLKILGVSSWLYLLFVHVRLLRQQDCVSELAGSYIPVMMALTEASSDSQQVEARQGEERKEGGTTYQFLRTSQEQEEQSAEGGAACNFCKHVVSRLLQTLYKQTTPAKQRIILEENAFQAVAAVIYLLLEGGSPFVAYITLAVPICQLLFAFLFHDCLRRRVLPWLGDQLIDSIRGDNLAKAEVTAQELGLPVDLFRLLTAFDQNVQPEKDWIHELLKQLEAAEGAKEDVHKLKGALQDPQR